jgi:hypothetical protein
VIGAGIAFPVIDDHREVEVPVRHFFLAVPQFYDSRLGEGDGSKPGGGTKCRGECVI